MAPPLTVGVQKSPSMGCNAKVLALYGGQPLAQPPIRFNWPLLNNDIVKAVSAQLHEATSLYDRSGVVQRFEDAFATYVCRSKALAVCSGTAALHSLYYGASLSEGDEVIVADYGFFATVMPLLQLGVTPKFIDCSSDGTMSVEQIRPACSARTRAVIVTHMWGQPAEVDSIRVICNELGLLLFEDCSHAHGARFRNRVVGEFGDGAAWSMQTKKTLWAGEGGVLCTDTSDIYERALLLGHFNGRSLDEIPSSSPNRRLAFTGTGLKYRAHPIALAIAMTQIGGLDSLIEGRQVPAEMMCEALEELPGVQILSRSGGATTHSYYSLIALIDPSKAGFSRERFVEALQAENVHVANIPNQMQSMHSYPVFDGIVDRTSATDGNKCFPNSQRISRSSVKFFVPAVGSEADVLERSQVVVKAIEKVAHGLRRAES
jgi:perosamine synthetase